MNAKHVYSSRTADKFVVRLPDGMREQIAENARKHYRSMNSHMLVYIETGLAVEAETGKALDVDTLRGLHEVQFRNERYEQFIEKLLKVGSWFKSAIELDAYEHKVDGEELAAEAKELLASKNTPVNVLALMDAFKEGDTQHGQMLVAEPSRHRIEVNDPCMYDGHLWVVKKFEAVDGTLWADLERTDSTFQHDNGRRAATCEYKQLEPFNA